MEAGEDKERKKWFWRLRTEAKYVLRSHNVLM
jgi:hypothetical protein